VTRARKITLASVLLGALVYAVADVGWLLDSEEGNTISSVLQGQPWAAGAVGFTAVHVFRPKDSKTVLSGWWGVATGAIISTGAAAIVGGGLFGLAIGGGAGWLTWSNDGKS